MSKRTAGHSTTTNPFRTCPVCLTIFGGETTDRYCDDWCEAQGLGGLDAQMHLGFFLTAPPHGPAWWVRQHAAGERLLWVAA